jgi:hypothetical protein
MATGSPNWNADIRSTFGTIRRGRTVRGLQRRKVARNFWDECFIASIVHPFEGSALNLR